MGTCFVATTATAQTPSFSNGPATVTEPSLFECGRRSRVSPVGTATSEDGKAWTVPAETHFKTAPKAADLYNDCSGVRFKRSADLDLSTVPLLDAGGDEEFVAYVFADNYFELYVNGQLLAVDPVPFTPFNSNVVRFKATRPITIAVKMVDWEENSGQGSESNRGSAYHPGDGGLVTHIQTPTGKTVAITDQSWRAQTFYTGPLKDRACLKLDGVKRLTSACDTGGVDDASGLSMAHWPVPSGWSEPGFDDSQWPAAVTFSNETVGVNNKKAYMNFQDLFDAPQADAQFIWSSNLVLDNLVLIRKTIP